MKEKKGGLELYYGISGLERGVYVCPHVEGKGEGGGEQDRGGAPRYALFY